MAYFRLYRPINSKVFFHVSWSQRKKEAAMAKLETSMVAREKEAAAIAKKKEAELQKRSLGPKSSAN